LANLVDSELWEEVNPEDVRLHGEKLYIVSTEHIDHMDALEEWSEREQHYKLSLLIIDLSVVDMDSLQERGGEEGVYLDHEDLPKGCWFLPLPRKCLEWVIDSARDSLIVVTDG
jgi:hypothetical protein